MQLHGSLTNCFQISLLNHPHAFTVPSIIEAQGCTSDFIRSKTNSHLSIPSYFDLSWHLLLLNICLLGEVFSSTNFPKICFIPFFNNFVCSIFDHQEQSLELIILLLLLFTFSTFLFFSMITYYIHEHVHTQVTIHLLFYIFLSLVSIHTRLSYPRKMQQCIGYILLNLYISF